MGTPENCLPWPRGKTACDGYVTPTSSLYTDFCGQVFEVTDTVHGTNQPLKLRAMKLEANVTVVKGKVYKAGTTALDFGRTISGVNSVAGGPGWFLDDEYATGTALLANDIVYFVQEGPVYGRTETSSVNLSQHGTVVSDASGYVDGAAPAAGNCVLGRIDEASTTTNTLVVIHVAALVGGEGA